MVPCEECLLIPICRNKYFIDMKNDCSLLEEFLFTGSILNTRKTDFHKRITEVYKIMTPLYWEVGKTNPEGPIDPFVGYFKYDKKVNKGVPFQVTSQTTYFSYSGPAGNIK